jgi:hypothetical protein
MSNKPLFLLAGCIYTYCNDYNCNNIIENKENLPYCYSHTPECHICLDKLFTFDIIQVCDNKHFLHTNCCKKLLNNKCPCCRSELKDNVNDLIINYNINKIVSKLKDLNKTLRYSILIKLFNNELLL